MKCKFCYLRTINCGVGVGKENIDKTALSKHKKLIQKADEAFGNFNCTE